MYLKKLVRALILSAKSTCLLMASSAGSDWNRAEPLPKVGELYWALTEAAKKATRIWGINDKTK